jgi:hypothetical protein
MASSVISSPTSTMVVIAYFLRRVGVRFFAGTGPSLSSLSNSQRMRFLARDACNRGAIRQGMLAPQTATHQTRQGRGGSAIAQHHSAYCIHSWPDLSCTAQTPSFAQIARETARSLERPREVAARLPRLAAARVAEPALFALQHHVTHSLFLPDNI